MSTKIFVNVPVKDLEKSTAFFTAIGFTINPQFSDETAACVVISEDIYAMLLTHEKFKQFTSKEIADATRTSEVLLALSFESRDKVNETADTALKSGGSVANPPQDYGFMFTRSISDPDGHIWEFFWMDPANVQAGA
jgi:predicted lactoylglutathione lyase